MKKLLITTAVSATLALTTVPSAAAGFAVSVPHTAPLVAKVGCWDECEEYYEAAQEARAEAAEEAAAYAEEAEEAIEEGYVPRRSGRSARRAPRAEAAPRLHTVSTHQSDPEPEPAPAPKKESEKTTEPRSSDAKSAVAINSEGRCKQYFASVGMTLSVPCG